MILLQGIGDKIRNFCLNFSVCLDLILISILIRKTVQYLTFDMKLGIYR